MLNAMNKSVYYWDDVQNELCRLMGIDPKFFRDYHKLVGGDYKDLWHVWLKLNYDDISNDSCKEFRSYKIEEDPEEDWQIPFYDAIDKLLEELQTDSIMIYYSW